MVTISVIKNDGSPTSSICRPLLPSGVAPAGRPALSSTINKTSSPVLMLSRSSFSSTSEISLSSDLLSSSRRSSALPSQDVTKLSPVGEVNPFPSPSAETSNAIKEAETEDNIAENGEPSRVKKVVFQEKEDLTENSSDSATQKEKSEDTSTPSRKIKIYYFSFTSVLVYFMSKENIENSIY